MMQRVQLRFSREAVVRSTRGRRASSVRKSVQVGERIPFRRRDEGVGTAVASRATVAPSFGPQRSVPSPGMEVHGA